MKEYTLSNRIFVKNLTYTNSWALSATSVDSSMAEDRQGDSCPVFITQIYVCSSPHLVLFLSLLSPIVSFFFSSSLFSLCSLLIWKIKTGEIIEIIFSISFHRFLSFPLSSCSLSYRSLCYLSLVFKAFLNLS